METEVYVIRYAHSRLKESLVVEAGSKETLLPISFCYYLIKTNNRNILVDVGCDTLPGFVLENFVRPDLALLETGVCPEQITDVVLTHAHRDHIEGIHYYKNATAYMTGETYRQGKEYIPQGMKVHTFENVYFLEDGIRLLEWGGHCAGSAVVEIQTNEKTHILVGDECYTNENIQKKLPTGAFADKEQARRLVEIYSDSDYVVHTCHDISLKTERVV